MNFLKFLFHKKTITYLGRGGLKYFDGVCSFYVDTNNTYTFGKRVLIEIFYKDIKPMDENITITDLEKREIALKVKKELEANKIHVEITPSLPIDFLLEYD